MDILTHTLSGIAVGTVVSSFSPKGFKHKTGIVLLSGLAGALPDFDVISLWSQFDSTIGAFFNLPVSGKVIYSAKYWYSHHAFMHSAMAALLFAVIVGLLNTLFGSLNKSKFLMVSFFCAFLMHLFEDMPTPASTWGGVNFFFPSNNYIGGIGDIWWWNNYDIFLIVLSIVILNLLFTFIQNFIRFDLRKVTTSIFIIGFACVIFQVKTRDVSFAYSGYSKNYAQFEQKSKQIQKELLGERLFNLMERFDNQLKIYF
ncbi:metal-dependent hydrolase [Pasteurella atlantica]|uniref:metal-dependent hydrolase n=1 Tax=Pasteurellaceae TaxID=712 RepID=UPI00276114EB|nr:metal-dependent hydrolase [Pasteurella atlantica]MDP8098397.1 metal-dependent hydrolase [Pasteurella atlantica]MDP8106489.1 metal-dependent hydrolase [Pasteurella atlantica]MDP8116200.1 metal-dependent hydrolase [Pasteurella atlantica]